MKGVKKKRDWQVSHYFFVFPPITHFGEDFSIFSQMENYSTLFWLYNIFSWILLWKLTLSFFIGKFNVPLIHFFIWERMKESQILFKFCSQVGDKYSQEVINCSSIVINVSSRTKAVIIPLYLALLRLQLEFCAQFWASHYKGPEGLEWV